VKRRGGAEKGERELIVAVQPQKQEVKEAFLAVKRASVDRLRVLEKAVKRKEEK